MNQTLDIPGLKIDKLVARGGMAEVYLAEQTSLGRKVAVKVMDPHEGDAEFSQRFLQEAKFVAGFNHGNIITIFDFGALKDGRLYLTMEYLPGGDLEQRLKDGEISEKKAVRLLRELSRALNFVHKHHVLHRDIKPANILFRQDGSLVLTDFGIAKEDKKKDVSMTQAGMTVGSPAYSSPEQAQGKELTAATDIYSLGVIFLEMLTGSNPYRADSHMDTAIKHIQMPIPRLPAKFARYQTLLDKTLAKDPKDRFQSTLDTLSALDQLTGNMTGQSQISRVTESPSDNMLAQCSEKSLEFSNTLLTAFYEAVQKDLDALLETSLTNAQQWQVMSVIRELRKKKEDIQKAFQGFLSIGFDDFSRGEYQKDHTLNSQALDIKKLSLLQHEDLEKNIAAANLIKRVSGTHHEELLPLHKRLCHVIKKELPEEACPIGPNQIARYFKKTMEPLPIEQDMNQRLFKILEKCLIKQVGDLYKSLNEILIGLGVFPEMTFASLMKRQQGDKTSDSAAENSNTASMQAVTNNNDNAEDILDNPIEKWKQAEVITPNTDASSTAYQQQLFGAIRQMQYRSAQASPGDAMFSAMHGTATNDSGIQPAVGTFSPGDWAPAGGGQVSASPQPVYSRKDVVTALHGLQDSVALADNPDKTGVRKAFKEMKPGHIQVAPVQSLDTVIDALVEVSPDEGDELKQLGDDDCGTIDLVGMIFEYMLKDKEIPDAVKAMLSYLHVPYIKVALLNPQMFARPDHPARMLLDQLSEAGSLWTNKEGFGQFRVFDEIKRVIDQVLSEFDSGMVLFETLSTEFKEFTKKVNRRVEQLEKLSAQKAEAEQHVQKVKACVHKHIKAHVKEASLPAPLVSMLLYPWFDYLTSVMLRYGEKSKEWTQGLQVIDTLLWSVKPKTTEHEVHRLNNVKGFLREQIQKGFDTIGYDQDEGEDLLKQVEQLQADAIKQEATQITVSMLDQEVIERIKKDTMGREKIVAAPKASDMTKAEQDVVKKLSLIEFGTWFEFNNENESSRANETQKLKVAWYNPETLCYLMVNSAGKQVSMINALELAQQMIAKTARILAGSAKPFFERALEAIYEQMAESSGQTGVDRPAALTLP